MAEVLVIDDEESIRTVIQAALEMQEHHVRVAENGRVGLNMMHDRDFDVVFVDLFMPEQDGPETIPQIRREFPNAQVVAISGGGSHHMLDALKMARYLGAHLTMLKPFTLDELQQAMQTLAAPP